MQRGKTGESPALSRNCNLSVRKPGYPPQYEFPLDLRVNGPGNTLKARTGPLSVDEGLFDPRRRHWTVQWRRFLLVRVVSNITICSFLLSSVGVGDRWRRPPTSPLFKLSFGGANGKILDVRNRTRIDYCIYRRRKREDNRCTGIIGTSGWSQYESQNAAIHQNWRCRVWRISRRGAIGSKDPSAGRWIHMEPKWQ